ncbi:MAG TPA: 2-C-methyl-D-erythritol 4-phosphate cytidylyltransferase [Gammaproteobacteria bacterium]|nr:2-C-methyl-D-erythritol 4-phosphate cytidylyltransferase [Gammaproteobacteria bacterium]
MNFWALIPAAGVGRRMGTDIPKQYLTLGGRTVLEHTLDALARHPDISGLVLVLGADDPHAATQPERVQGKPLLLATGGAERSDSVSNGLERLVGQADDQDWVLVHDAARPCLRQQDLDRLIEALRDHPVGGLLGVPVRDTMKRVDADDNVRETVDREGLWHALTPQMFRFGALREVLRTAQARGLPVTDDASAMELAGHAPLLVEGHGDNLKITRPEDLALAEFYLRQQERL